MNVSPILEAIRDGLKKENTMKTKNATNETYEKMLLAERRAARVLGLYPVDTCPCGRAALDGRCCASGAAPMACDLPYVYVDQTA